MYLHYKSVCSLVLFAEGNVLTMADIHDNIYIYRKKNNMSLEELGKRVNTTKQTIQRYESREIKNIPYEKIIAIAEAFNISPVELMGFEQPKPDYSADNAMIANLIRKDYELRDSIKALVELDKNDKQLIYNMISSLSKKQAD